jgi:hypothetical protein
MFESRRIRSLSDELTRENERFLPFCLPAILSSNCFRSNLQIESAICKHTNTIALSIKGKGLSTHP